MSGYDLRPIESIDIAPPDDEREWVLGTLRAEVDCVASPSPKERKRGLTGGLGLAECSTKPYW